MTSLNREIVVGCSQGEQRNLSVLLESSGNLSQFVMNASWPAGFIRIKTLAAMFLLICPSKRVAQTPREDIALSLPHFFDFLAYIRIHIFDRRLYHALSTVTRVKYRLTVVP